MRVDYVFWVCVYNELQLCMRLTMKTFKNTIITLKVHNNWPIKLEILPSSHYILWVHACLRSFIIIKMLFFFVSISRLSFRNIQEIKFTSTDLPSLHLLHVQVECIRDVRQDKKNNEKFLSWTVLCLVGLFKQISWCVFFGLFVIFLSAFLWSLKKHAT